MHFKKLAATLLICALPAVSQARDTAVYLPFDKAVAEATRTGKIDGSVKFYLAVTPRPAKSPSSAPAP